MAKTLIYQLYPIAWEGGDDSAINMMTGHLKKIKALGADYVWLSPVYPSPRFDHGYDISDYRRVDYRFGNLSDLAGFIDTAHDLGVKVLMDLVLNHTSTEHHWFSSHPEYYCWSDKGHEGWKNLFDGGPAWKYVQNKKQYYLHLFHPQQVDLNWFPDGKLNEILVAEFQSIVDYWCELYGVDGFRLDVPQAINKDLTAEKMEFSDLLFGERATEVVNAIFEGYEDLFLMMECFDPTGGELVEHYGKNTPVDFVLDVCLKDEITKGEEDFTRFLSSLCQSPYFMLDLESHDSPRFPSRDNASPEDMISWMYNSDAKAICLYQGQELCLHNPTKMELPDRKLAELDAQTAMQIGRGADIASLRPLSRANARVPISMEEYRRQEKNPDSYLNLTKEWIKHWKLVH